MQLQRSVMITNLHDLYIHQLKDLKSAENQILEALPKMISRTHDEGAVEALDPERVLLLPDGVEDLWNTDYLDLVTLA